MSRRQALLGLALITLTACSRSAQETTTAGSNVAYYTCTMHPFVRSLDPGGKCPVCGMNLVPVMNSSTEASDNSGSVGKADGMVHISPERLQEIGVTTEVVTQRSLNSPFRVLSISTNAVIPTGAVFIAFVDHGEGRLEPREVKVGIQSGDYCQVISGLNEGDRVVTSANFLIDAESRIQGALKTWGSQP